MTFPRWLLAVVVPLLALIAAVPAAADVTVTFWSHSRDQNYQHAFIVMQGEANGVPVDSNIGFTARRVSPLVLIRSVEGMMETVSAGYIARATSRPHFALRLDDAQYARLAAFIARWRAQPQPNYNLNRRNCVHFVMEAAATLGLNVNRQTRHLRDPQAFLDEVMARNPQLTRVRR